MQTYFGESWDVPATEGAARAPTPVGQACLYCSESIQIGDRGYLTQCVTERDDEGQWVGELRPVHRECQLLGVSGHRFGWCRCTGYQGLTPRDAALALWDSLQVMR